MWQRIRNYNWRRVRKWLRPGLGVKRYVLLLGLAMMLFSFALAQAIVILDNNETTQPLVYWFTLRWLSPPVRLLIGALLGGALLWVGLRGLNRSFIAPLWQLNRGRIYRTISNNQRLQRGLKVVALGGGTGLPAVLRGMKQETAQITAVVTMADDGGSSGKLRRNYGVLPPGDVRNNIAALAEDEARLTLLFQYRFGGGDLEGHSFGNLFLTALASITGSMEKAIAEAGKVLAIQGRVLPSTIDEVNLAAQVRKPDHSIVRIVGESHIPEAGGQIERVFLKPESARAFPDAVRAILAADVIVIGPGSLYTSILPNLLVNGIPEAIRTSTATARVYVCNIAMQHGETDNYDVRDHVLALERHVGRGLVNYVLANNTYPTLNAGQNTHYVQTAPPDCDVRSRYIFIETDLTDPQYPWRHSSDKLRNALLQIYATVDLHKDTLPNG